MHNRGLETHDIDKTSELSARWWNIHMIGYRQIKTVIADISPITQSQIVELTSTASAHSRRWFAPLKWFCEQPVNTEKKNKHADVSHITSIVKERQKPLSHHWCGRFSYKRNTTGGERSSHIHHTDLISSKPSLQKKHRDVGFCYRLYYRCRPRESGFYRFLYRPKKIQILPYWFVSLL